MEAQFHLAHITVTTTKFYHALAALPPEVVGQLPASTLSSQDYDSLKAKIVELHEASKPEILDRFLRDRPMTGRPSQYLAEMEQLAAKAGLGEEIVRHRFQKALPSNVGPIIATQKTTPLADLGKLADELLSLCANGLAINRVPRNEPSPSNSSGPQDSVRSHSLSQDLRPFSANQRPKICRSHIFFADRARTCRSWCRWPNKTCPVVTSARNTPHNSRENSPSRSNERGQL